MHEFEELIGRKATEQEYIEANAMYMDAGEVDKFDFCKEWKTLKESKVAKALLDKICALRKWKQEGKQLWHKADDHPNNRHPYPVINPDGEMAFAYYDKQYGWQFDRDFKCRTRMLWLDIELISPMKG